MLWASPLARKVGLGALVAMTAAGALATWTALQRAEARREVIKQIENEVTGAVHNADQAHFDFIACRDSGGVWEFGGSKCIQRAESLAR